MKRGNAGGCIGIFLSCVLLFIGIIFFAVTAGPVFGRLQYGVSDIYSLSPNEIKENRYVTIEISDVYGRFFTTYSTDSETGKKEVDNYYYATPYTDDNVLVIKTRPYTQDEGIINGICSGHYDPNSITIKLEGVLEKRSVNIENQYAMWAESQKNTLINKYGDDFNELQTFEYVLDCSNTFAGTLVMFIISAVLIIGVIVFWIIFFAIASKGKKRPMYAYPQGSYIPQQTNTTPVNGMTMPQQMNTFYPQSAQPQAPNMYPPSNQPNGSHFNPYDQQSGFNPYSQMQPNDPYLPPFNSIDRTNTDFTQQGVLHQPNNTDNGNSKVSLNK